jgi:dihydrofolate synthase/folylpolyglutamate synthase
VNYQEALEWLYSTQLFGIKLGLDGPRKLLREFLAFPTHRTQVIHVAGTNGKGSTCAMIDSLGRSLALRTGLFTSPHLVDYRERIRVSGGEITEERTAELLSELKDLVSDWDHHPTFFELTLALAMRHFRESNCELIILETGMGGRLDATTVVPADVCVLTPIALDHTKWLGSTITEIAQEKAAIALHGKPLISAVQTPEAQIEIERVANQARATLSFVTEPLLGYHIALPGEHQRFNARLACEAISEAGHHLSYDVVQHAFSTLRWPGRFEVLESTHFGHQRPLILDAAHNPHAAQALIETWKNEYRDQKAQIIFGAVEDKDALTILKIIEPICEKLHLVPVKSLRGIDPNELCSQLTHIPTEVHESVNKALTTSAQLVIPTLITGSLFLIGEAKSAIEKKVTRITSQ